MKKARVLATAVLAAVTVLAAAACSGQAASSTFTPTGGQPSASAGGAASDAAAGSGGYVMPPFGPKVHVSMTSWLPGNPAQAQAVNADKDYVLAFLYSEYKGGQDDSWSSYVTPAMQAVSQTLQAKDVTTESFTGAISYFDMGVIPDPLVKGDLDVSACFDNAGSTNTDLTTGAALPDTGSADSHYARISDELRKDSSGQWQVVAGLPSVYYPEAAQCKP